MVDRLSRTSIWGLGIYVNTQAYKYVALQFGPFWLYLWHEAGLVHATSKGKNA